MTAKTIPPNLAELPCSQLKGIGPRLAERLAKCGIQTVQDLLFHLPSRYQDRTRITPIGLARPGDHVVIEATIISTELGHGRRRALLCHLQDETAKLTLRFFYFSDKQQQSLKSGLKLRCFGEIRGWGGEFEMIHPEYQYVNAHTPAPIEDCLTPIYPTTEGLTQHQLRSATEQALILLESGSLPDYLPLPLLEEMNFPNLATALRYVHRPPSDAPVTELLAGTHPTQQRLSFEELIAHHLTLRRLSAGRSEAEQQAPRDLFDRRDWCAKRKGRNCVGGDRWGFAGDARLQHTR